MTSATLEVINPGWSTLVVDRGRPHTRSLGVPIGGPADRWSHALGNGLVGNAADTAALEITLSGPILRATAPLACVLYGAPFDLHTDHATLEVGKTFTLAAEEELHIAGTSVGVRAYLCVQGGIQTSLVLGSRSSLAPIPKGHHLPCQVGTIHHRFVRAGDSFPSSTDTITLRFLEGAQASWFPDDWHTGITFRVTPASNRMGVRLEGEPFSVPDDEMVSEPVCPGTVQVTRNGQCVILGVDGQTIGGYPKIAQVISADLDLMGQCRPGVLVRFQKVNLAEAEELYRQRQATLRSWLVRMSHSLSW